MDLLELYDVITFYINQFMLPILAIACVVMGIIIICTKEKAVKLLGAYILADSLAGIFNYIYLALARNSGDVFLSSSAQMKNIIVLILSWCVFTVLFMFVKFRYNTRVYYLYIMIGLFVFFSFLAIAAGFIWNRFFSPEYTRQYSYLYSILTIMKSLAVSTVFLIIFMKNRFKEPDLKILWVFQLLAIIVPVVYILVNLTGILLVNNDTLETRDMLDRTYLSVQNMSMFIMPALSIYILVKGKRPALEIV